MEENKLLSKEEFEDMIRNNHGKENIDEINFVYQGKYKSLRRAFRRGHCTINGTIIPRRPFNNRKPTPGRMENESKKMVYAAYKRYIEKTKTI